MNVLIRIPCRLHRLTSSSVRLITRGSRPNAFCLDPLVISRTLEEVSRCKRQGILINTFMLASDYGLVNFIQKVTELCRGKAYFTTPYTLGQYLLMDYMNRKTRTIH